MKIEVIKHIGGTLTPVDEIAYEDLQKLKTGEQYEISIKLTGRPAFHRKTFAFFKFCYAHWSGGNKSQDEKTQFKAFRNELTILAGFYNEYYSIAGELRVEAKSLSYASMNDEEFSAHYNALINAAMANLFWPEDMVIQDKLYSFF